MVLPKPEVILTHESDLDGLLAGLLCQRLAREWFQAEVPLQAFANHLWRQRQLFEAAAWVCDLAFEPRLDRPDWVVFDHHPYTTPPRQARLIHDPGQSAAALCYGFCREAGLGTPKLDVLVHLSNVADLFLVDDPAFETACDYANLVKVYGFGNLLRLINSEPEALVDHPLLEVMRAKRLIEDPIGLAWGRKRITPLPEGLGLVETVVGNRNLIVHQLLQQPDLPYRVLMTLHRRGTGQYLASLRSRNGEALTLAERLHGGGHPNASGATLPRSVQSFGDAVDYLTKVLTPKPAPSPPTPETTRGLFEQAGF